MFLRNNLNKYDYIHNKIKNLKVNKIKKITNNNNNNMIILLIYYYCINIKIISGLIYISGPEQEKIFLCHPQGEVLLISK